MNYYQTLCTLEAHAYKAILEANYALALQIIEEIRELEYPNGVVITAKLIDYALFLLIEDAGKIEESLKILTKYKSSLTNTNKEKL